MARRPARPAGVIVRDAHLQIDLRTYGFGKERLELAPTPANIAYAQRLRNEILGKIERGTFALAEYFPNSPRASKDKPSLTVGDLAREWLKVKKATVKHSTAHHYNQTVTSKHFADVDGVLLGNFGFRELQDALSKLPTHPKTFNNIATVWRQMLEYGFRAKLVKEPLHESIEMRRFQPPGPDPFTREEIAQVLASITAERGRNYYDFAFFSGMRPSELIALRWSGIGKGTAEVAKAFTRGQEGEVKNYRARVVELTSRAAAALERQRKLTGGGTHVFVGMDDEPYTTTDGPLDAWWKPALAASGLRYRDARQTRHTFATICLMGGIAPGWVARQLGHSPEMFFRVYSRWIEGADKGAERRKLDAFLGDE